MTAHTKALLNTLANRRLPKTSEEDEYVPFHELHAGTDSSEPPDSDVGPSNSRHPLAKFAAFDLNPKPPRWLVPGFIGQGVVTIAGQAGVGKTTVMLPLAMVVAGLHREGDPLAPKHWRHVIYITEDLEQAQRIMAGLVKHGGLGISTEEVMERVHLVEACRLDPAYVASVGKTYREQFSRNVAGVDVLPLVVIDTKSAVLELENENDNSETSRAIAALKQNFAGLPTWLVGHIAKQSFGREDIENFSTRGAGSNDGDVNQTLFVIREKDGTRYLVRGKTRFEAAEKELRVESHIAHEWATNEYGEQEMVFMRWGMPVLPEMTRAASNELAKEQAEKGEMTKIRQEIRYAVQIAWQTGTPINRQAVMGIVRRNRNIVSSTLEVLIAEGWLYEVSVPSGLRTHPKRCAFLVDFTTEEHEAFLKTGIPPEAKTVIPQSWKKPEISYVSKDSESGGTNP